MIFRRATIAEFTLAAALVLNGCTGLERTKAGIESTLIRDDWGVPHIYAKTEPAGYYALGYARAEDQGERVMMMAKMAIGEAASIKGESMLASDIEARRWMHADESRAGFAALSPHIQENYRAFASGFSRYYSDHPGKAPGWHFDLEPWHLIAIPRGLLWESYMAGDGLEDCRRGGVKLSLGQRDVQEERAARASNQWVLHPERTADRAMMLLGDPHGGIDGGFCYEFRMHAGELHLAGYSFGGPLLLGHNRSLSWAMTTGSPDVSDCYAVETDPANPLRYQFDGEWKTMTTRNAVIKVKDGEPRTLTFAYTHHNGVLSPVIATNGTTAYVVCTPYMHQAAAFDEELDHLNRATNVKEAKAAMRDLGMFAQNVMVADAGGNSWYVRVGRTPKRPAGFDWNRPVPGNCSDSAWLGLHSLEDLVQLTNPPQGYMQNNNLSPDQMTLPPAVIQPGQYPSYIFNDRPGRFTVRGVRANEVLSKAQKFTIEEAIDLALDERWLATAAWKKELRRAAEAAKEQVNGWSQADRDFLDAILSFDGNARADSAPALKYFLWRQAIYDKLDNKQVEVLLREQWTGKLGEVVLGELLLVSVSAAAKTIQGLFGRDDATLGDLVRVGAGEKDYPVGGIGLGPLNRSLGDSSSREETLRAFGVSPLKPPLAPFRLETGSRLIHLVVFTKPIQSFTLHNFGQSDKPESPHFDDQVRLLTSRRKMKPVYFERRQLEGHIKSEMTLNYERDDK